MSFPSKADRQRCWDARDRYWECLDKSGEQNEKCVELRKLYETACPAQWVKHFDRKRNYLKFKERIQNEGYEPLDNAKGQTACSTQVPAPSTAPPSPNQQFVDTVSTVK